ncbi:Flp family type IVb pilin [Vibrio nigripulchritudo]|uniref:Flp pilus assembly protein pilin Flp (Modular protein) n=1 Tax=Vibrio nigripulchritudo SOn1 TaxID=1238450 RepID=A0AAV2VTM3_9VIBR|nr:Flp family type IVb pilin [Vibrio nigripulchritudo]CCN71190.1 Flp pilus assembly protein pilin Flp (modular protein) [Vibrio nigripulchritudo SFn118]CCO48032.1 Flp pilus assembly protein pilin Flp (modular protein) [Vibrio nigripulchritudo SOn1]
MLLKIRKVVGKFSRDERGVTAVEYAIIAVVISGIVLAAFNSGLGGKIQAAMAKVEQNLTDAQTIPTKKEGEDTAPKTP